jgi:hypothetical protein
MLRRLSLGLLIAVLTHVGVAVTALFVAGARLSGPVEIEVTGLRIDQIKDLPLGSPERGSSKQAARAKARSRGPKVSRESGTLASRASETPPQKGTSPERDEGGPAPTSDLGAYGPQGSRVTVLMRLDRLRGTPYVPAVDHLLMFLPDRRELIQGTGLNLFDDFDAVLIATPNPLDPTVTFLAARHHVEDGALRAALMRGTRDTHHTLTWRTEAGRPVGEWRWHAGQGGSFQARDARLIVLAAPGLAVVTPPAYRALLLGGAQPPDGRAPLGRSSGSDDADAGADGRASSLGWAGLLSRIDAEEGLMPPDGVVMVNVADIIKPPASAAPNQPALFYGIEVPPLLTAVVALADAPYLDINGVFKEEENAERWERAWPTLQRKLRTNPYLVLGGFSALIGRATLSRDGATVLLHLEISREETERLLALAATFLSGRYGDPGAATAPR